MIQALPTSALPVHHSTLRVYPGIGVAEGDGTAMQPPLNQLQRLDPLDGGVGVTG